MGVQKSKKSFSLGKTIIYSFLPLLLLLFFLEIGGRIVYYQSHGNHKLALTGAFYKIKRKVENVKVHEKIEAVPKSFRRKALDGLFQEEGQEVLAKFEELYEKSFLQLVGEAKKLGSKLIILYIPTDYEKESKNREVCRTFYRQLSQRHQVDFLDLTEIFLNFPAETVTLAPHNGHLSRYGNQIVTREVSKYIDRYSQHRIKSIFADRPAVLGDLTPNENKIWDFDPRMPYRVVVNSQGLRMGYELKFPKDKQRILCLGDSFTFGPYMANHNTYPDLLGQRFTDKEIINAGICGYTVEDEGSLFSQRAKYCEPDIIVLQALDNDIPDFFYFYRQQFSREQREFKPTPEEARFFRRLNEVGSVTNSK